MMRWLLVIFFPLSAFVESAFAVPDVSFKEDPYPVYGSSAEEIRGNINRARPQEKSGARFDADTRWHVKWKYKYIWEEGICTMTDVLVSIDITLHLPEWKDFKKGDAELQSRWTTYMKNLRTHENGHVENGKAVAKKIENLLLNLPPMSNCDKLSSTANQNSEALITQAYQKDLSYDQTTQHGKTQGATFP